MYDPQNQALGYEQLELRSVSIEEPSGRLKKVTLINNTPIPPHQDALNNDEFIGEKYMGYRITISDYGSISVQRWGKQLPPPNLNVENAFFGDELDASLDGVINEFIGDIERATVSEFRTSVPPDVAEYLHQLW